MFNRYRLEKSDIWHAMMGAMPSLNPAVPKTEQLEITGAGFNRPHDLLVA